MTVAVVAAVSVYTGYTFFQPIVVEQLRKDGNLRQDIEVPQFDSEGNIILPKKDTQQDSNWWYAQWRDSIIRAYLYRQLSKGFYTLQKRTTPSQTDH